MKKSVFRKVLMAFLAVALVVSAGFGVKTLLDFQQEEAAAVAVQETFVTVAQEPTPLAETPVIDIEEEPVPLSDTPECSEEDKEVCEEEVTLTAPDIAVDFEALMAVNEDICGWLYLPGADISYPLLQGETNQTYLRTAYDGTYYHHPGSLFLDYRNSKDFADPNTVVYGHNMLSNTMFSNLDLYEDETFVADHPIFYVMTADGYLQYEICYVLNTWSNSLVYSLEYTEERTYASQLAYLANSAQFNTGISLNEEDQIICLSTCADGAEENRLVVVGRLVGRTDQ